MHFPPPPLYMRRALTALEHGGVIAYPTEAVWGLGCDPANEDAVERLLALKRRPESKGLILIASAMEQVDWLLGELSVDQQQLLAQSWPGPTTWLVPHHNRVPPWIHGDYDTVAIRVSAHPVVKQLCDNWGGVMVSTSANRAGAEAAVHEFQVHRYFHKQLDFIVPGRVGEAARPSAIRDIVSGRILRA